LDSVQNNLPTKVLVPYSSQAYACRIIPELNGIVVGFDIQKGGFVKTDRVVHIEPIDRDFTTYSGRILC
jgi:hypothetical protein